MTSLTPKERIIRQARGQEVDCIPSLGGWINGSANICELAGIGQEQYRADPMRGVIRANKALGVDGMIQPIVPVEEHQVRTGAVVEEKFAGIEPEAILERANALPDSEAEILKGFDPGAEEKRYRDYFTRALSQWEGIVPVPNFWEIGGHFPLYTEFGYVAFLSACAMYPEAVGKIWWAKSLHSRERSRILVRLYQEFDLVPLMFCGEDLCNNQGPMVSPEFLRKYYFPTVRMITQPLVDAGVRLVHHCDGDVRPVLQDFINCGFSGFQGFQNETGVDPYEIRNLRSLRGEAPIFFTGLSVSRTLPFGTVEDVRDEVDYFIDYTDGGKGMLLFTTNVVGPEVPARNLVEAYRHVKEYDPAKPRQGARHRQWPWLVKHPEK